jgi:hypothetical protein
MIFSHFENADMLAHSLLTSHKCGCEMADMVVAIRNAISHSKLNVMYGRTYQRRNKKPVGANGADEHEEVPGHAKRNGVPKDLDHLLP